jgi:hypothetical protein
MDENRSKFKKFINGVYKNKRRIGIWYKYIDLE